MAAVCHACGETWPRDPALEIECPDCRAPIGSPCKRPSGHRASRLHNARDAAAMAAGIIGRCSAAPAIAAAQPTLF